jgi:hypothetical protein
MHIIWHVVSVAVVVAGTFAVWGTSERSHGSAGPVTNGTNADSGFPPSRESSTKNIENLSVLYVLDPISSYCFEEVGIDPYTNQTLIPWVMGLKDALTSTNSNPDGEELMVSLWQTTRSRSDGHRYRVVKPG